MRNYDTEITYGHGKTVEKSAEVEPFSYSAKIRQCQRGISAKLRGAVDLSSVEAVA